MANESVVYFVQCEGTGRIKIGRTTRPVIQRMRALQTSAPHALKLIGEFPEGHHGHTEGSLHRKFAHLRLRGEWFKDDVELLTFIAKGNADDKDSVNTIEGLAAIAFKARKKLGLRQEDLAELVGVSRKWLIEFERGKASAEIGLVLKLFQQLGIVLAIVPVRCDDTVRMNIAAQMSKL
jgi:DNA-binding XRE family transcriptional regulator